MLTGGQGCTCRPADERPRATRSTSSRRHSPPWKKDTSSFRSNLCSQRLTPATLQFSRHIICRLFPYNTPYSVHGCRCSAFQPLDFMLYPVTYVGTNVHPATSLWIALISIINRLFPCGARITRGQQAVFKVLVQPLPALGRLCVQSWPPRQTASPVLLTRLNSVNVTFNPSCSLNWQGLQGSRADNDAAQEHMVMPNSATVNTGLISRSQNHLALPCFHRVSLNILNQLLFGCLQSSWIHYTAVVFTIAYIAYIYFGHA